MSEQNDALDTAVIRIAEPLVRMLLRHGKAYNEFAQIARYVYADVANREFPIENKRQTVSRVAVLTGLHRKDVRRLLESSSDEVISGLRTRYNRLERVLQGWLTDDEFCSEDNKAKALELGVPKSGFEALVKRYSGDMPARAILDELLNSKTAKVNDQNQVELIKNHYQPHSCDLEALAEHAEVVRKHLLIMESMLSESQYSTTENTVQPLKESMM